MGWSISSIQLAVLASLVILVVPAIRRYILDSIERKGYPLPPGPTPVPFLGSALSINVKEPWLTYAKWRKTYGDVMHVRLLDTDVIVLSSSSAAADLLDKRSRIYSDRPYIATAKPYGHDCNFSLAPYGEHWRLCRRIFHQTFRADAALKFRPMQLHRARRMILNIIEDPDGFPSHYSTFSAAVAMSCAYDYEPKLLDDSMVSMMENFTRLSVPMLTIEKALLLRVFPFLLHIPDWLPGSSFKRRARAATVLKDTAMETTHQYARKRMESQDGVKETMVSEHVNRMEKLDHACRAEYEVALKHACMTAFFGSTGTTSSTIMTFTLAMVKNPRVWKRAQAEIDAVVGIDRLPEFDDRQSLPYIDAVIRETYRWKPISPLNPRATTKSDVYKDFYIPKGATVFVNVWAIMQDEDRYPTPETFLPERFLDTQGRLTEDDPAEVVFGFGRRMCPGRYTGDASVWSAIATMLATLEFNAAKDEDGNDVACDATFITGITCRPMKFPCRLTLRAHVAKEALEDLLA